MADDKMVKATLKNTSDGPRGFHASTGMVTLEKGQTWKGELHPDELKSAEGTGHFNGEGGGAEEFSDDDIKSAVDMLDHANDDHWTKGGEPSVEAVGDALNGAVTRAQIKAAAPDAKRNPPA
jgi:hypothetical protein